MKPILPIPIEEILAGRAVESARLELKASWDHKTTGPQVLATITAFANDLQNLNGGYIVIGVAEDQGVAVRPVKGVEAEQIDAAQKWIRGHCNRIEPGYMPILSPEEIDGRQVLVIQAPASDMRPHQAPGLKGKEKTWFVRIGSETVEAKGDILQRLLQQQARVPYNDQRALQASVDDLSESLVRQFLRNIHSKLADEKDTRYVYDHLRLIRPINAHQEPRNVALLFFSENPEKWFPTARIEVVQFADDAGGNTIEERIFRGPLHEQTSQALNYLKNLSTRFLEKVEDRAQTRAWVSYPANALDEALVNAVYHRAYDQSSEPIKVYLYPDRMEIISYPGPVDGIEMEHLTGAKRLPPVPARNRRVGEFFKDLRLAEGRGTGIPKIHRSMAENGSPEPEFDFDRGRSYFRVTLPAHPEYVGIAALRDANYLKATGDRRGAIRRLHDALRSQPGSALIAATLIEELADEEEISQARAIFDAFPERAQPRFARLVSAMADAYLKTGQPAQAEGVLDQMPPVLSGQEAMDAAIIERRLGREQQAHGYFLQAGEMVYGDVKALHEFAQNKMKLTKPLSRPPFSPEKNKTRLRLLQEAETLLDRVVQLDAPPTRRAWAWYHLGQVRNWLKKPVNDVIVAYEQAVKLNGDERQFRQALERIRRS